MGRQRMQGRGAVALVTGGSSGIGRAIAVELARMGAHVHIAARRADLLDEARDGIAEARMETSQRIDAHVCDVASEDEVAGLFETLSRAGAMPSIVVNSAGVSRTGYFQQIPAREFERVMRVNYLGTVHVLKRAVPPMIARRGGHILNISSVAGLIGVFGMSPYVASKFAVRGLSETLRSELKPHGIAVSLLCPPDTETPMLAADVAEQPAETAALSKSAGVLSAEAVARAAIAGMSQGRATIIPGLESCATAWLQRLAPSLVERISDRVVRRARGAR